MANERKLAVTVHRHDGTATTTLHLTSLDDEAKFLQIIDDLGLDVDDDGYTKEDPDIRRVTIRKAPEIRHHDQFAPLPKLPAD